MREQSNNTQNVQEENTQQYLGTQFVSDNTAKAFGVDRSGKQATVWACISKDNQTPNFKFYRVTEGDVRELSAFEGFMPLFKELQQKYPSKSDAFFSILEKGNEAVNVIEGAENEAEVAKSLYDSNQELFAKVQASKEDVEQKSVENAKTLSQAQGQQGEGQEVEGDVRPKQEARDASATDSQRCRASKEAAAKQSAIRNAAAREAATRSIMLKGKATIVVNVLGRKGEEKDAFVNELTLELKGSGYSVEKVENFYSFDGSMERATYIHSEQASQLAALNGEVDVVINASPSISMGAFIKDSETSAHMFTQGALAEYHTHNNFTLHHNALEGGESEIDKTIKQYCKENEIYAGVYSTDKASQAAESITARFEAVKADAEKTIEDKGMSLEAIEEGIKAEAAAQSEAARAVNGYGGATWGGIDSDMGVVTGGVQFEDDPFMWVSDPELENIEIVGLDPALTNIEKTVLHSSIEEDIRMHLAERPHEASWELSWGQAHHCVKTLGESQEFEFAPATPVEFEYDKTHPREEVRGWIRGGKLRGQDQQGYYKPLGDNLYYRVAGERVGSKYVSGPWEKVECIEHGAYLIKSKNALERFDKKYQIDIEQGSLEGTVRIDGKTHTVVIEPGKGLGGVTLPDLDIPAEQPRLTSRQIRDSEEGIFGLREHLSGLLDKKAIEKIIGDKFAELEEAKWDSFAGGREWEDIKLVRKRCLEITTGAKEQSTARAKELWKGISSTHGSNFDPKLAKSNFARAVGINEGMSVDSATQGSSEINVYHVTSSKEIQQLAASLSQPVQAQQAEVQLEIGVT